MRDLMVSWLTSQVGISYSWGGDDYTGFDCSGLAQEFLMSFGAHPNSKVDFTAQALHNYFSAPACSKKNIYSVGALLFFGKSTSSITHVGICLNDLLMIEAGGGGSSTITLNDAIKQNAFVRMRPIANRKDLVACLIPNDIIKLI